MPKQNYSPIHLIMFIGPEDVLKMADFFRAETAAVSANYPNFQHPITREEIWAAEEMLNRFEKVGA